MATQPFILRSFEGSVIGKLQEYNAKSFEEEELDRCFQNCASPIICKRIVTNMIERGLTINHVEEDLFIDKS